MDYSTSILDSCNIQIGVITGLLLSKWSVTLFIWTPTHSKSQVERQKKSQH